MFYKIAITLIFSLNLGVHTVCAKSKTYVKTTTKLIEGKLNFLAPSRIILILNPSSNSNYPIDLEVSKSLLTKIKSYRDINVAVLVSFKSPEPKIGQPIKLLGIKKVLNPLKTPKRYRVNKKGVIVELN